jgi:Short C-terminal domain
MTIDDAVFPLLQDGWSIVNKTDAYAVLSKKFRRKGMNKALIDVIAPNLRAKERRVTVTVEDGAPRYNGYPSLPSESILESEADWRAGHAEPPQAQSATDSLAVASALAALQDLRAKNLITEEEFQAKRKEHLDRL